jgi:hypothetical protein
MDMPDSLIPVVRHKKWISFMEEKNEEEYTFGK